MHNALGKHDVLWDTSPKSIERFMGLFTAAASIDASVIPAAGHSIDHHKSGHALHLRQLAFAHECALRSAA